MGRFYAEQFFWKVGESAKDGFHEAESTVFAAVENINFFGFGVQEDDELPIGHFDLKDSLVNEHGFDGVTFSFYDFGHRVFDIFEGFVKVKDFLVEVLDIVAAGAMIAQNLGFVLAHLACDLGDDLIDRGVEVVAFVTGFDGDVVAAMEDDFGKLTMFFDIEDDLGVDDSRVIEVKIFDFFDGVILNGFGDADVATGDFDGNVDVGCLHGGFCAGLFWVTYGSLRRDKRGVRLDH